jgi:hypothetical protein
MLAPLRVPHRLKVAETNWDSANKGTTVNKFDVNAIAIAIGLCFSAGAMAQDMSKDEYKSGKNDIAAAYKSARAACGSLAGNAKELCMLDASGRAQVAAAELEARYEPSVNASYKVRVVRAEADYAVARAKCDDAAGNVKDVCVEEAKAIAVAAKADAKVQKKTTDAHDAADEKSDQAQGVADEKTFAAQKQANEKSADARKDAATEKREAGYAVAKEKCDAFAGDAKSKCMNEAKARYGKS